MNCVKHRVEPMTSGHTVSFAAESLDDAVVLHKLVALNIGFRIVVAGNTVNAEMAVSNAKTSGRA